MITSLFCLLLILCHATRFAEAMEAGQSFERHQPMSLISAPELVVNTFDGAGGLRQRTLVSQVPFGLDLDLRRCDESKCISSGPEAIVNRTGQIGAATDAVSKTTNSTTYDLHRFDCYYKPNSDDDLLCAAGYTGVAIDTNLEPSRMIASPLFYYGIPVEQNYYTCCPAYNSETEEATEATTVEPVRRCSDPRKVLLETDNALDFNSSSFNPMPCNDEENGRIFPRPLKESMPFYPNTYMCCDEELEEEITAEEPDDDLESAQVCDESRCIGRTIGEFLPGYSCWGEGPNELNPYACSDGYVGIPVDSQPPMFDEGQFLKYYTCCPPSYAAELTQDDKTDSLRRHCSDPISYEPSQDKIVCHDPVLQYPRKNNKNGHFWHSLRNPDATSESYVCCDVELPNGNELQDDGQKSNSLVIEASESYFDEVDCVLSCDPDFLYDCWAENKYGFLWPMGCDDPNGVFIEPKIIGKGYAMGGRRFFHKYGCCREGMGTGPFIQDKAFNQTVWPQLILSILGVITSVLLIIGLLLSFFYGAVEEVKTPVTKLNASALTSSVISGTTVDSRRRVGSGIGNLFRSRRSGEDRSIRSSRRKGKPNANGGYNAYLVYLAIPDLILNLFVVGMYASYVNQKFVPGFSSYIINSIFYERKTAFDMALILACSAANLYLNAIISYELFTLLKNSNRRLRTPPPTFKKVGLQALAVYAWAICIFLIRYFTEDVKRLPTWVEVTLYFMISAGIPILYLCYVCFVIWRRKLLPSMNGPLRVLALYFFRIIAVFLLLWLPGVFLLSFACNWQWDNAGTIDYNDLLYPIGLYFCSVQPVVSTGMAMTKPDVRAAMWKLFQCSYCRAQEISQEAGGADVVEDPPKTTNVAGGREVAKTSLTNSSVVVSSVQPE